MLITYPDIFGTHTAMFASKLVQDTHEHSFRFGSKRSATSAQDDLRKDNTIPNASLSAIVPQKGLMHGVLGYGLVGDKIQVVDTEG